MSQQNPQHLYPRSPRYHLKMNDKKILRYAPYPRGNRSFFTDIHNLSETGMAFTVPYLDTPNVDELIMVEFAPPGGEAIACYAQVKRIQNFSIIESDFFQKNCKLVAVRFVEMKEPQREALRACLDVQFKKAHLVFNRQQMKMRLLWMLKFRRKPLYFAGAGAFSFMLFLFLMVKFLY